MGFLTDEEAATLRLARMILHIVGGEDEFEPQDELPLDHDDFLLQILKEIASDSVYQFSETSPTRDTIENIATRRIAFKEGAQALAYDFCRLHQGTTKDGAFFVFELGVADPDVSLYALVKYDYSQALEVIHREGTTGLRRIVEAFIGDKAAIQKSAIVRTRNGIAEQQLSTRDRMGRPLPNLTEYFRSYLQVNRERSDQELTNDVREVIRTTLSDNREFLPAGGVASCVSKALDVLRSAAEINEDVIQQAVWVGAGQPTDVEIKARLKDSATRLIKRKKLTGIAFLPPENVLPRSVRRTVTTTEGVKIEYHTALDGSAVREERLDDGRTRFTVTTEGYRDDVGTDRTRAVT